MHLSTLDSGWPADLLGIACRKMRYPLSLTKHRQNRCMGRQGLRRNYSATQVADLPIANHGPGPSFLSAA